MTDKQWQLLEILDRWGGMGTIEVEIQFGSYDFGDSEAEVNKGDRVCRLVVSGLMRTLVKKGYATNDANGYDITAAGREVLERQRQRWNAIAKALGQ